MAKTREHLAILRLSEWLILTVALTKADRVGWPIIDVVYKQMQEELA